MRPRGWLATLVLATGLAACETTGDPRSGGLFGWSEQRALVRQEKKRAGAASAEAELAGEAVRGRALEERRQRSERRLLVAQEMASARRPAPRLEAASLAAVEAQQPAVELKVRTLEALSRSPSTASRARSLAHRAALIFQDRATPPKHKLQQLEELSRELDAAIGDLQQ